MPVMITSGSELAVVKLVQVIPYNDISLLLREHAPQCGYIKLEQLTTNYN